MSGLSIRLLGTFEVLEESGAPLEFGLRKADALIAVLGRHPGERHSREKLSAMLWPESPEAQARANLRQALKYIRRTLGQLGEITLISEAGALILQPMAVEVDVARFESLHARSTLEALDEAEKLYRGEFLEGFNLRAEPFTEWVELQRIHLGELARNIMAELSSYLADAGETERALKVARRLIVLDPLQESAHRLVMRLYEAQGRRGAAIEQYRRCREVLRRQLSVGPEAETEHLYREIRTSGARVDVLDKTRNEAGSEQGSQSATDLFLQRPAVAVIPFRNLTGDPGQAYFADGLSEEILTALAGWRCFPLISSSSVYIHSIESESAARVADDLGARYAVDGSIRRSGNRLRITVRLLESASGYTLWTDRFDFHFTDVLVVQEEAAQKIAAVVEPELERAELRRIFAKQTEDLTAWDLLLRGISLLRRETSDGNARARSQFEHALRLDPDYSDAFTGLALGYLRDIWNTTPEAHQPLIAKGMEAAHRAIELDRDSSMAHLAFATANVWAERLDVAIPETELAIDLNPSNAQARCGLGNRLDLVGRTEEGIVHLETGLRLDPRGTGSWNYKGFLSRAYLSVSRYDRALEVARDGVKLRPDQPLAYFRLAACLAHLGRVNEARVALRQCERLHPGFIESRKDWQPYANPSRSDHFFAGLRRQKLLN